MQDLSEELPEDGRQSETAFKVRRGVMRYLRARLDFCVLPEITLANGRRADIFAIGPKGEIWIVEVKSSLADFQSDKKWPDYQIFCDRFFFAKPPELANNIFPEEAGLFVADAHGAEMVRDAPENNLAAARRKAVTLRVARASADRLHGLLDPKI